MYVLAYCSCSYRVTVYKSIEVLNTFSNSPTNLVFSPISENQLVNYIYIFEFVKTNTDNNVGFLIVNP